MFSAIHHSSFIIHHSHMTTQTILIDKKKDADKLVKRYTAFSAGAGWIPLPLIDSATIAGIQLLMIRQLAGLYETPFKDHLGTSLSAAFLGSVGTISGFKFVPGAGKIIGGVSASSIGAASTYALGKVFTQHFDQGGTLFDFDPEKSRAYFKEEFEKGKNYVLNIKNKQSDEFRTALNQLVSDSQTQKTAVENLQKELEKLVQKQSKPKSKKVKKAPTDLKVIEGIGPKIEAALNAFGIHSWYQLSNTEPRVIKDVLTKSKGNFKLADPASWPEQAALAEAGKFEELEKLQKELKGGKYSKDKPKS